MKQKEAFAAIRALGLTVSKRDGEYRVAFPKDEASAYYTGDLADAVGTARAMASHAKKQAKAFLALPCSNTRH